MRLFYLSILLILISSPAFAEVDCSKKERRIDVLDCVHEEYKRTEENLKKIYKQAIFRLHEDGKKDRIDLLKLSQQDWENYRFSACDAQIVEITGLSEDFKLKTRLCHIELAQRRQEDLLKHFKTWDDLTKNNVGIRNSAITKNTNKEDSESQ